MTPHGGIVHPTEGGWLTSNEKKRGCNTFVLW